MRTRWTKHLAAAVLAAFVLEGASAQQGGAPLGGVWKEQAVDFDYMGFTDRYSCLSLRERMATVLRRLGAHKDPELLEYGCGEMTRPTRIPGVRMKFATLFPTGGPPADAAAPAGSWRRVNLIGVGALDPEECELTAQIVRDLLPHFAVRNVPRVPTCVPHAETRTSDFVVEVFVPEAQK